MNPTKIVLPAGRVGARRLPVGPSMASTDSLSTRVAILNSLTFLPFATMSLDADLSNAFASAACSFLLAGVVSLIGMLLASRNLDARVQLVQPPR